MAGTIAAGLNGFGVTGVAPDAEIIAIKALSAVTDSGANGGSMAPSKVMAALKKSAEDLGKPGRDDVHGFGRVNALNAVNQ